jgi:hypothetical protein
VSGIFDPTDFVGTQDEALWLFVDDFTFDGILGLYGMNATLDSFAFSISIPIQTTSVIPLLDLFLSIPSETDYANIDILEEELELHFLPNATTYGNFQPNAQTTGVDEKTQNLAADLVNLGISCIGGSLFVLFFAYLVARFRKREVAILKAMGYSKGAIRLSLLAEIATIAALGFLAGIGATQGFLLQATNFAPSSLLRPQSIFVSFLVVVLITLLGVLVTTMRALSVSVMEAFRDK